MGAPDGAARTTEADLKGNLADMLKFRVLETTTAGVIRIPAANAAVDPGAYGALAGHVSTLPLHGPRSSVCVTDKAP